MPEFSLTPEVIVGVTAFAISLIFSYFPVLRTKFAALSQEGKSGIMIGLMALATIAMFLMSCTGWISAGVSCDQVGVMRVIFDFVLALAANQGTYKGFEYLQPKDVKEIKAAR